MHQSITAARVASDRLRDKLLFRRKKNQILNSRTRSCSNDQGPQGIALLREDDLGGVLSIVLCLRPGVSTLGMLGRGLLFTLARCALPRAPPSRPWWQASGSVERHTQRAPFRLSGATLLPRPCGRSAG